MPATGTNGARGVVRLAVSRALVRASRLVDGLSNAFLFAAAAVTPLESARIGIAAVWDGFGGEAHATFFPWEEEIVGRFIPSGAHVLVVGCGSGRDTIAFLERGCRVTGIDPAPGALARARAMLDRRELDATLECAFIEDWTPHEPVDVIWFSWFTYGYIPDSRRRIEALGRCAAHLTPGGRVVISYQSDPPASRATRVGRVINRCVGNDWTVEDGDRILRGSDGTFHYEHRFTDDALERELRKAGLRVIGRSGPAVVAEAGAEASAALPA